MIKFLLIIGIVVCCALIGVGIKNYFLIRFKIFKDFKGVCKSISNEITFLKTDKYTMLKNQALDTKQCRQFIDEYIVLGKGECVQLKNAVLSLSFKSQINLSRFFLLS